MLFTSLLIFLSATATSFAVATPCPLLLDGAPVNAYTREAIARHFSRSEGRLVAELMTLDHVLRRADVDLLGRVDDALALVRIKGVSMFVRPAGRIARAVLRRSRGQMNVAAPFEHHAFDYFDGGRVAICSSVKKSLTPKGLGENECVSGFANILELGRRRAGGPGRDEMVRLTHEHPAFEVVVRSASGRAKVMDFPLNRDDYEAGLELSRDLADVTFVISAVTLGGLEYFAAFRNGYDVTVLTARKIVAVENLPRESLNVD